MSTIEPGLILPATPVSASTRIAISRSPVASSGGEPIMPSCSTLPAGMSASATWPIRRARSRSAVFGAQRRGSSFVLTMSSVIALSFSAGFARASTSTLGSTSARTSATYPATSTNTPRSPRAERVSRRMPRRCRGFMSSQDTTRGRGPRESQANVEPRSRRRRWDPRPMRLGPPGLPFGASMRHGERGQILPGLLVVMLALLAVGVLMFQVGKAAVLRSDAQTAADAAALAGAEEIKRQLIAQWATTGTTNLAAINQPLVRAQMRLVRQEERRDADRVLGRHPRRRRQGGGHHRRGARQGREGARQGGRQGPGARPRADRADARRSALGGSIGPLPGGGGSGSGSGPEDLREGLEGDRGEARRRRARLRRHGRARQVPPGAGLRRRRERRLRPRRPRCTTRGSYHYKCGSRGAIDVNFGGPGDLDPLEVERRRPDHRAAARARLPHDLARGRPLQPPARRRRQLGPDRRRLRRRATAASPARSRTC